MIVKIENLEQEKYVLECAEKDGFNWKNAKATGLSFYKSEDMIIYYESFLLWDLFTDISQKEQQECITFEQFKVQREQNEFVKQSEELTKHTDLEKENEELKKKLSNIERYILSEATVSKISSNEWIKGYCEAMKRVAGHYFKTPEQTKAKELIEKTDPKVLEELKKLLQD